MNTKAYYNHVSKRIKSLFLSAIILTTVIVSALVYPVSANAATLTDEEVVKQVFDANYYASNNADVVNAVGGAYAALIRHYMAHGIYEGRDASASFNATAYRQRYSDLNDAFGDDMIKYVRHYVTMGISEARDASPIKKPTKKAATTNVSVDAANPTAGYSQLGSYSTKYVKTQARATNIIIAASHVNGTVIPPGGEFSYTNTVLPRTPENGYVMAPVFVNKEHSMGIGGGICQVSSTIYACMKTIGLPATERHAHSLPVTYVPEGWDATVSGIVLDLKFVNTYSQPLMIIADATDGVLTVSLWLKN